MSDDEPIRCAACLCELRIGGYDVDGQIYCAECARVRGQCIAAALIASIAARSRSLAPRDPNAPLPPMKVPNAPPGDARYAGPPPIARARSWKSRGVL